VIRDTENTFFQIQGQKGTGCRIRIRNTAFSIASHWQDCQYIKELRSRYKFCYFGVQALQSYLKNFHVNCPNTPVANMVFSLLNFFVGGLPIRDIYFDSCRQPEGFTEVNIAY
jgi:hypothetical protein